MWATQRVVQAVGAMSMLTPCLSIMQIARVFWKKGIPRLGGGGPGERGSLLSITCSVQWIGLSSSSILSILHGLHGYVPLKLACIFLMFAW